MIETEVIVRSRSWYPITGQTCVTRERVISWEEVESSVIGVEALLDKVREQVEAELQAHIDKYGHDSPPWKRANDQGEMPGDICCQRAAGEFCHEHDPRSYR